MQECAFCREDMKPDATVCPHCSKRQPLSPKASSDRRWKIVRSAGFAMMVGVVALFVAAGYSYNSRAAVCRQRFATTDATVVERCIHAIGHINFGVATPQDYADSGTTPNDR